MTGEIDDIDRVRAQPFALPSGTTGVVVVTERLQPYEQAERYALLVSVVTGLLAVIASALLAAWVSRRALRPVLDMATTASEWSEHDLGRRFDLGRAGQRDHRPRRRPSTGSSTRCRRRSAPSSG